MSRGKGVGLSKSIPGREWLGDGVRRFTKRLFGTPIGSSKPSGVKRESVLNGYRRQLFVGELVGISVVTFVCER